MSFTPPTLAQVSKADLAKAMGVIPGYITSMNFNDILHIADFKANVLAYMDVKLQVPPYGMTIVIDTYSASYGVSMGTYVTGFYYKRGEDGGMALYYKTPKIQVFGVSAPFGSLTPVMQVESIDVSTLTAVPQPK